MGRDSVSRYHSSVAVLLAKKGVLLAKEAAECTKDGVLQVYCIA